MKIRVRDVGEVAEEVEFEQPVSGLNAAPGRVAARDYECADPARVGLTHYRAGTDLFFDGTIDATVTGTCARCLEEFRVPVATDLHFLATPRGEGEERSEAEDVDVTIYDGEEVDLGPLVCERILLSLPTTPLCGEDCRGLCPRCGINLNQDQCECPASEGDPRMSIFRNLRVGR